ncbi:MAG TPA: AAA family ATPase, partial [Candidatus Limnocylindria bacterium]
MQTPATSVIPVHLPPQPTRLIDRENELALLRALLSREEVRLLTLTGPGGVGKTRLAIAAAEQVQERFPDGVWFVDLAPLADPALVVPTIARVVGVREIPGHDPLAALTTFLGEQAIMLVLDNLEHLLAAVPVLDALLVACPDLTILATSREPLRLRREQVVEIRPLPVPGTEHASWTVATLAATPAVQLFVVRAQAADATFELSPANAEAVAELSRRLDGLPLAIELAAPRTRMLPPAALLARLGSWLPLLTGGPRDAPARQQTMRDAIAWSYGLLPPEQQALFRRLAVFAGGFTLEGAEAIAGKGPHEPDLEAGAGDGLFYRHPTSPAHSPTVLEDLVALIDHSLVQRVDAPAEQEPRYRMLETVREFALERLEATGAAEAMRRRHLAYLVGLAERLAERVWLPEAERVLARLDAEHDD